MTIEERVAKGAAFLDEHRPDWWKVFCLDKFDLTDGCCCVLGQLGKTAYHVATELGLSHKEESWDLTQAALCAENIVLWAEHGFWVDEINNTSEWRALEQVWRQLIATRKEADHAAVL